MDERIYFGIITLIIIVLLIIRRKDITGDK